MSLKTLYKVGEGNAIFQKCKGKSTLDADRLCDLRLCVLVTTWAG